MGYNRTRFSNLVEHNRHQTKKERKREIKTNGCHRSVGVTNNNG